MEEHAKDEQFAGRVSRERVNMLYVTNQKDSVLCDEVRELRRETRVGEERNKSIVL